MAAAVARAPGALEGRALRFLFAPAAPRPMAALRAALAAVCVVVFWPASGSALRAEPFASLHASVAPSLPYRAACVAILALFALGVRPRASGLAAAALLLPLDFMTGFRQSRQVLIVALAALALGAPRAGAPAPMWPARLVQLQLTLLYGLNALAKTTPEFLRGDVLLGMSEMLPNWRADLSGGALHLGPLAVPVAVAAPVAVATEWLLAAAFWLPRARPLAAAIGVAFHLALLGVVRIGMLDVATVALYLAFLLPREAPDAPEADAAGAPGRPAGAPRASRAPATATGSTRLDACLFGAALLAMVAAAPRLRVYHSIDVVRLEVREVCADGSARPLPLPEELRRLGYQGIDEVSLARLAARLARLTAERGGALGLAPGACAEWTVRTSRPGAPVQVDRRRTYVLPGPPG